MVLHRDGSSDPPERTPDRMPEVPLLVIGAQALDAFVAIKASPGSAESRRPAAGGRGVVGTARTDCRETARPLKPPPLA